VDQNLAFLLSNQPCLSNALALSRGLAWGRPPRGRGPAGCSSVLEGSPYNPAFRVTKLATASNTPIIE